jgi:hypothetical protein
MSNGIVTLDPDLHALKMLRKHTSKTYAPPFGVRLTLDERKRTLKFRPGGERIVELMVAIATRYGVKLPGVSVEGLAADHALSKGLEPVRDAAESVYQLLDDTVLEAQSESWFSTTAFYSALSRMVDAFPDIKGAIDEAAIFFARKRSRTAEVKPPETTPKAP